MYAAPSGSASSNCTLAAPCTLDRAITVLGPTRSNIKLLPGIHIPQSGQLAFTTGYAATLFGPGSIQGYVYFAASAGSPLLRLKDLTIRGGVECSSGALQPVPTLEAQRVTIESSENGVVPLQLVKCQALVQESSLRVTIDYTSTIVATGTTTSNDGQPVRIERSVLQAFEGGATTSVHALVRFEYGVTLDISNSILRGGAPEVGTLSFGTSAGSSSMAFNTFYNTIMKCPTGNLIVASHDNIFVNDLAGAPADTLTGTACSHTYALVKPQATNLAGNNIRNVDPQFVSTAAGDFHLLSGSPAIDAANPAATQATDYDGTPRPQGAARDIGAFEYH